MHDRSGRHERNTRRTLGPRRICRHVPGQSLCAGKEHRRVHLQRTKIWHACRRLAESEEVALKEFILFAAAILVGELGRRGWYSIGANLTWKRKPIPPRGRFG